jgi:hypothetical protein
VATVYGDELLMNLKSPGSLHVGNIEPLEALEGNLSCRLPTAELRPDFELYIEDDLGREAKAVRVTVDSTGMH